MIAFFGEQRSGINRFFEYGFRRENPICIHCMDRGWNWGVYEKQKCGFCDNLQKHELVIEYLRRQQCL